MSALQGLQGKAAGVQVVQPSGKPGAGLAVSIRGNTSLTASNSPLYVVDNVPTNDISFLNPADIESFSVLKDASAAAIYGASGANGVVLITTRKGSARKAVVRLQTYQGFSKVEKKLDVLNTAQYLELMEELGYEDPGTYNTDWQDMVFGSGREEDYQLSVSGGGPGSQYFTSLGYQKRNWLVTVIKGGGWKKFNTPSNDIVRAFEEEGDNVRLNASIIYENQSGEGWTDDYWSKTKYPFINKFRDWDGRSNIYLL